MLARTLKRDALLDERPDLVAIGTGADELRLGPDELKHSLERDFH
jgi:hypothetical protein